MNSLYHWHTSVMQHPLSWGVLVLILLLLVRPYARLIHGRGRLSRVDYLVRLGFSLVVLVLGYGLLAAKLFLAMALPLAFELPLFVCSLMLWLGYVASIAVRRHHDVGETGWQAVLLLVPVINLFYLTLYLCLRRGESSRNRWGPAPHQTFIRPTETPTPECPAEPVVKNPLPDPQLEPGR